MTTARHGRQFAAIAIFFAAVVVLAVPAAADSVTQTWAFATTAEGFTATTASQSSAAHDGTTGNPSGALYTEIVGRRKSNANYWEWTGNFEDMGVPAGGIVSAIQLTGGFTRCTDYNNGDVSTAGPWELRDSTGVTVLATLYSGRTFSATDGAWVAATGANQALADLASNTTVRLRLNNRLSTANAAGTSVRLYDDQVSVQITYTIVTNTPPTVTITTPAAASSFDEGQAILFTGTASDTEDGDISANLSWTSSIDGTIGSGGSFSRSDLSVGTHTITASVTDSGGLSDNDQITLTVNNVAPTVTITAPADTATFVEGANITFTGTASDPGDGDLTASLAWTSSIDGSIGTGGSFSRTDLSIGTHTITASVTDSNSAPGQDQITITINANTPPTVTITAPADASNYNQGDNITFTGTASDTEDGDLTASLAWISSIDGSIGTGGSFSRTDLSPGSHTITASVTDSGSLVGQDQITITVNGPPTVTITAPTSGANFDEGANVTFTGTASDAEDGNLTASLAWTSSLDGSIGTGGSFSRTDLSIGTHTINASVTDSGGLTGEDQITVTINAVANDVTPGTPTASIDNCNQITVTAPFSNDDNGNSTTLFERSPNGTDSWAAVTSCGAGDGVVSGPSPRTCIDTTVADNSTNYYRVTFSDIDGVNPPVAQTIGPFDTTPFCGDNSTTIGTAEAEASSCNQVTAIARFTGDANLDGTVLVEYSLTGQATWLTACAGLSGASPRQCVIPELSASTGYDVQITFSDPDGVGPDTNLDANTELITPTPATVTTSACGPDTAAPTLLFLTPARDAILGGTDSVKVQVFDADLVSLTVQYSVDSDGDANLTAISQNTNYDCGTNCAVYEFTLDTTALGQGSHFMTIKATDTEGNIARLSQGFQVNNSGGRAAGNGLLLRRTHGSQVCVDCHNLPTHSSQSTSTKYGNWAMDCVACHTPHLTQNIYLISPQIRTPNSGLRDVRFETTVGAVADSSVAGTASYANEDNATQADGPCQVCHTRTKSSGGDARWRNATAGGNVDTHYASASTSDCIGCHTHDAGFSGAGGACDSCHFAPPTVGKHGSHDEIGTTPTAYANLTPLTTPTQYGFACGKCHTGSHFNDPTKPHTVEVIFDDTQDPKNPTGTYASDAPSQATDPGANGDGWYWSDGDCSNLYCHSNAQPLGGLVDYDIVTWDQVTPLTCAGCHNTQASDDTGGTTIDLSDTHGMHIQSTSGETGTYSFKCDECHAQTIKDNPADPWNLTSADFSTAADQGKVQHVDGGKDVFFSSAATAGSIDQSGGSYAGNPNYNCSDTYCHSQGTSTVAFLAPNDTALSWNGGTSNCRSCHSGDATAAPTMATGAHGTHVNNVATIGTNYECSECHSSTVGTGNNELITSYANHVDGAMTVTGAKVDSPYTSPNCAGSYCHSSGQAPAGNGTSFEYYSMNWNTDTIGDCKGCHGRHSESAFTSTVGEPNYTNDGAGTPDANSHQRHVASAGDCTNCHNSTTTNGTQILAAAPHTDLTRDVVIAPGFDTGDPNYTAGTKTCQNVACHGSGTPQWGGTLACLDCHDGPDGGTLGDGTPNGVGDEWNNAGATGPGHGTSGYGNFATAGGTNPSAVSGCDYCHDLGSSHTPTAGTNPYRVRFSTNDNTLCLQCHLQGDTGISQNSEGTTLNTINSAADVDTAHYGAKHEGTEGGKLCWDCHDPHGVPTNILMVKASVSKSADQYGVPGTAVTVNFTDNTTAGAAVGRFIETTNNPRTGICQACHDPAGQGASGPTDYWRSNGTIETHNATQLCTDCHFHTADFKGAGGDCLGCHADTGDAGTQGPNARRPVQNDFGKNSHHVGASVDSTGAALFTQPNMGGALTNFDCVVCHAEGKVDAGDTTDDATLHKNGTIDLRDTDVADGGTGYYFSYDKDAIDAAATAPANWMSGNTIWETQTSTALDPFCLSCHDSDGASANFNSGSNEGLGYTGSASNPFADSAITNEYDQVNRVSVVNIRNRVDAYVNATNSPITPIDREGGAEPRTADGRPDPTLGIYSRHAIRGDGTFGSGSVYGSSQIPTNRWVPRATGNTGSWNDTSVMGCADCHTTDGANTTNGNAHGSNTEYLLKDADGLATTEPGFDVRNADVSKINCYKCHIWSWYAREKNFEHTDNNSDWVFTADQTGSASRLGGNGNLYGLPCTNCHGGAPTFGTIHGTSDTFNINAGPAQREAYRFMNGASLRYYDPNGWNTATVTCYTLSSSDNWGGCTQHPAGNGKVWTRPVQRPIQY